MHLVSPPLPYPLVYRFPVLVLLCTFYCLIKLLLFSIWPSHFSCRCHLCTTVSLMVCMIVPLSHCFNSFGWFVCSTHNKWSDLASTALHNPWRKHCPNNTCSRFYFKSNNISWRRVAWCGCNSRRDIRSVPQWNGLKHVFKSLLHHEHSLYHPAPF